jgi:transcriptional regulator with XRE-family HTH domain
MTPIRDYLRQVRLKRGYSYRTVEQLSAGTVGKSQVERVEKGGQLPSPQVLCALASVYQIDFVKLCKMLAKEVRR